MIYWFIFITLEIARNYYMIEVKNTKPVYFQSFILRGWAHLLICIFVFDTQVPADWYPILAFHACSFWLLFDPALNLLRKKPWYYRGKTSGWLDRIPSHIIYWLMKVAALTYCIQYYL